MALGIRDKVHDHRMETKSKQEDTVLTEEMFEDAWSNVRYEIEELEEEEEEVSKR